MKRLSVTKLSMLALSVALHGVALCWWLSHDHSLVRAALAEPALVAAATASTTPIA